MKNESGADRRERIDAERVEEDKRLADAAATEAAAQAERDRLAAEEKARQEADALAAQEADDPPMTIAEAEAERMRVERYDPPMTFPSPMQDAIDRGTVDLGEMSTLPLPTFWELYAKNREAPPFHFTGVAHRAVVAARSAEEARHIAAGAAGDHGVAWLDDMQTDCTELERTEPGLIALDFGT